MAVTAGLFGLFNAPVETGSGVRALDAKGLVNWVSAKRIVSELHAPAPPAMTRINTARETAAHPVRLRIDLNPT
jgi:hypothetical protein